ncbi:MAG: hypothetical protein MUC97_04750 [Bernardetiaceae bacterium]|jgi:hypothetical protein|nr:hypothetical protein [Bernardetiaceae bacterium]
MELHFKIAGWLLMGLALAHAVFPWYFNWKTDLAPLSLINRQVMQVHTFFIAFTVLLMGGLCASCAPELATTALGKKICLGLALFWTARWLVQFFGYSARLWRGKPFETFVHLGFSGFWTYLVWLFWTAYLA